MIGAHQSDHRQVLGERAERKTDLFVRLEIIDPDRIQDPLAFQRFDELQSLHLHGIGRIIRVPVFSGNISLKTHYLKHKQTKSLVKTYDSALSIIIFTDFDSTNRWIS